MRKVLMATGMAAVIGYGSVRWQSSDAPTHSATQHDAALVQDRMWVDHLPQHDRDRIEVFVALTQRPRQGPRGPFGAFEKIGPWEGHFEAFRYESHGDEMRIVFPQRGDRETLKIKATKCDATAMDYCLDVEGSSRGVKRYYSRKGWEIRSLDDADALVQRLSE